MDKKKEIAFKPFLGYILTSLTLLEEAIEITKYEDIYGVRYAIKKDAAKRNREAVPEEVQKNRREVLHNIVKIVSYVIQIVAYENVLLLDRDELITLFGTSLTDTTKVLNKYQKKENIPEHLLESVSNDMLLYDNASDKKSLPAVLLKTIIILSIYDYRLAARPYAAFLYEQYKMAIDIDKTNEFEV